MRFCLWIWTALLCCITATLFADNHPLEITVNHGYQLTNQRVVSIHLHHPNVHDKAHALMRFGESPDLDSAEWIPFDKVHEYEISGEDGWVTIYAQTRDSAEVPSAIASASIELDTQAPEGVRILINEGSDYTNDPHQKVLLEVIADGANEMQISYDSTFKHHAHWIDYQSTYELKLHGHDDGLKYVYARFRDEAGNISQTIATSITADRTPPTGTLTINQGDHYAFSQLVYLHIATVDEDVEQIRIEGHRSQVFDFEPGPMNEGKREMLQVWWLDSLEGHKIIRVYFKDYAGNVSAVPAEDFINLQLEHPEKPMVTINENEDFVTHPEGLVNLKIGTRDTDFIDYTMMISNEESFEGAERIPFARAYKGWRLDTAGDGTKTVFIKVFNKAGSASEVASRSIQLIRTKPVGKQLIINDGATVTNTLRVSLTVVHEHATMVQVNNAPNFIHAKGWRSVDDTLAGWPIVGNEGENIVYCRFKDDAGNISEPISASILLDRTPPKGKARIVNGAQLQTDPNTRLKMQFRFTPDARMMMLSNAPTFDDGCEWQPVVPECLWSPKDFPNQKYVYFRFKDEAGNVSAPGRASILVAQGN